MFMKVIVSMLVVLPLMAIAEEDVPEFEISCQDAPEGVITEIPRLSVISRVLNVPPMGRF